MFGNGCPALNASKFSFVKIKWIGLKTVFVTAGPLIPKNQKSVDRVIQWFEKDALTESSMELINTL